MAEEQDRSIASKLETRLERALSGLTSSCLVVLLLLLSAQVLGRFFRIKAIAPPDEIVNLFFAWMVFVGAAVLLRNRQHLRVELVDLFFEKHPRLRPLYGLFVSAIQLVFLVFLVQSTILLFVGAGTRTSPMLQWPQRLWYGSMLISSLLMMLYAVIHIITEVAVFLRNRDGSREGA
jgi:TRAP-type C4-dicarboxylate transport system permease small subunit